MPSRNVAPPSSLLIFTVEYMVVTLEGILRRPFKSTKFLLSVSDVVMLSDADAVRPPMLLNRPAATVPSSTSMSSPVMTSVCFDGCLFMSLPLLRCIRYRYCLSSRIPLDIQCKCFGDKPERKEGPAVDDHGNNLRVCGINGNRSVIDVSDIAPY